jgi:hypothetical protein
MNRSNGRELASTTPPRPTSTRRQELPPPIHNTSADSIVRREGLIGWWLNLTAPAWPTHSIPVKERERLRKAELTSFSILTIFAFLIALVSNSLANVATAQAVILMAIILLIAAILNRTGRTRSAAYLIPSVLMLLLAITVIRGPGGGLELIGLPIYDLFVIPIILVSLIGDRRAAWVFAAVAIAFVVIDFLLEPHALITPPDGVPFDDINYGITHFGGIWGMINRHVAMLFFAALFGWMGATSVDNAIARADRAEELARLEHAFAEQSMQLEQGIREIQQTHIKVANGDYKARAPLAEDHILWQIANALNNLILRLQRSAEAEHMLRRTELEVSRLKEEIQRAKAGQIPIWPQPSGTPLDPIIAEFSQLRARGGD